MEFIVRKVQPEQSRAGCLVVAVMEGRRLRGTARILDAASSGAIKKALSDGDLGKAPGSTVLLRGLDGIRAARVMLVRCGPAKELGERRFRSTVRAVVEGLERTGTTDAILFLTELEVANRDTAWLARTMVDVAAGLACRYQVTKSKRDDEAPALQRLVIPAPGGRTDARSLDAALAEGRAIANGKALAMELGNLPGNYCTPSYLAERARKLAASGRRIKVRVVEEAQMRRLGMGALLSVSRGSRQPAKLICMEYGGGRRDRRPVVLVGKGVTFDSGGISIKPGASMDEMKFDMCGAASVFGAVQAAAELRLGINVVGVIPATENLPDGDANKPGDVVTSLSGQTIEVLNTDAEGRLILCDALTYCERYQPDVVIDVATLTGACVVALGAHPSGLFSNYQPLADDLIRCGEFTGDRVWQMPVWEEYEDQLKSNFADVANVGGRSGGAITAACFLSRFTKDYRWAHLDIAGTAWHSGTKKGATARPVALLTQYLIEHTSTQRRKAGG